MIDDFPIVGLTEFDSWYQHLWMYMVRSNFISVMDITNLDREHWRTYYDLGYTYLEAFEEDLTCYGE